MFFAGRSDERPFYFQHEFCSLFRMTAENFIKLIEEMVDLKIQQQIEAHFSTGRAVAGVLRQKREADQQRLAHIRAELAQILSR